MVLSNTVIHRDRGIKSRKSTASTTCYKWKKTNKQKTENKNKTKQKHTIHREKLNDFCILCWNKFHKLNSQENELQIIYPSVLILNILEQMFELQYIWANCQSPPPETRLKINQQQLSLDFVCCISLISYSPAGERLELELSRWSKLEVEMMNSSFSSKENTDL